MSKLYIPQKKIAVASSFEGVVNNGARECAFVSFNAYHRLLDDKKISGPKLMGIMEPDRFNSREMSKNPLIEAFLILRPLVAVAEDYFSVIQAINMNMHHLPSLLGRRAKNVLRFFSDDFGIVKRVTSSQQAEFKKAFYAERKRMQEANYEKWLSLQQPYPETIGQLRLLTGLKVMDGELKTVKGFELYYVTSKDEATTYQLCVLYGKLGALEPHEVMEKVKKPEGMSWADLISQLKSCIIRKDNIIGLETVASGDTLEQMRIVMEREGVAPGQVWRMNDRYDAEEARALREAGFGYFVVTGGYAFPWNYRKAMEDGFTVIERAMLAEALCAIAKERDA